MELCPLLSDNYGIMWWCVYVRKWGCGWRVLIGGLRLQSNKWTNHSSIHIWKPQPQNKVFARKLNVRASRITIQNFRTLFKLDQILLTIYAFPSDVNWTDSARDARSQTRQKKHPGWLLYSLLDWPGRLCSVLGPAVFIGRWMLTLGRSTSPSLSDHLWRETHENK